MKLKEITNQHRRDFWAIYECEHCGHTEKGSGYDDVNFHQSIIPNMNCKKCDKKSPDGYQPKQTKYPEGYQI